MKQSYVKKIALDTTVEQLKWSIWFVSIMVILHTVASILLRKADSNLNNLFNFSITSIPIYMFVISIIAGVYFMPFYIRQGITRKNYFLGSALGALMLSAILTIIFMVLSVISGQIFSIFGIHFTEEHVLYSFNVHLVNINWVVLIPIYFLNSLAYYTIGWMISASYYRFGAKIGFCSILFSILSTVLHGMLWDDWLVNWINDRGHNIASNQMFSISILWTLALIAIQLVIIRWLTKKVAIKI